MRNYIPLNDNGRRAKAVLTPILDAWKAVREIEGCIAYLQGGDGAHSVAVLEARLDIARETLHRVMQQGERLIAQSSALSPAQVMILTLRYVRGCDWPTVARMTGMDRARLFQEHRVGLNGIDLRNERGIL